MASRKDKLHFSWLTHMMGLAGVGRALNIGLYHSFTDSALDMACHESEQRERDGGG